MVVFLFWFYNKSVNEKNVTIFEQQISFRKLWIIFYLYKKLKKERHGREKRIFKW